MLLTIPMGPLGANCYLLFLQDGGDAVLIDPSDADDARSALEAFHLRLTHILLTHMHFDHIAGTAELKAETGAAVLIHTSDAAGLKDSHVSRADWMRRKQIPCEPTQLVSDGDTVSAAGYTFRVMHTPGHTEGSVCYVCDEKHIVFTGDTVFFEGVGRTDLPGGDMRALMDSLKKRILTLPESYDLYPGHGEATTVAHEKKNNPFIRYSGDQWFN